jgi:ethanolaminephosphotransferase
VAYGNAYNTWLKLFPNLFGRHDGVHSFFVKDTVEVDNNVTRHLDVELVSNDWDLLVLHYLGLDHVGHIGGRTSPLMAPKLKEMDDVIMRIHQNVQTERGSASRTLLVVTSDHGMTNSGNHGGSTAQETDSLALFVFGSNSNINASVLSEAFQVDIVPTIALLLGVPVPLNSVGVVLLELFVSLTHENQLKVLEVNSWQLLRLVQARSTGSACVNALCRTAREKGENKSIPRSKDRVQTLCSLFQSALELQREWNMKQSTSNLDDMKGPSFEEVKKAYMQFLKPTSEWLARGSTEKHNIFLLCGSFMILVSTLLLLLGLHTSCRLISQESGKLGRQTSLKMIVIGGVCAHALSLGSSSFVEEEQYTWHFLVSTLFVVLLRLSLQKLRENDRDFSTESSTEMSNNDAVQIMKVCLLLLLGRILRSWHRSGVNWTHLPDLGKFLESGSPLLVTSIRIVCVCTVTLASCKLISKSVSKTTRLVVLIGMTSSAGLILLYKRDTSTSQETLWATLTARTIFRLLGGMSLLTLLAVPWTIPLKSVHNTSSSAGMSRQSAIKDLRHTNLHVEVEGAMDATGNVLVSCWCLLQLLLQQPVNAGPVLLLFLQLLLTLSFLRKCAFTYQPWFPILTLSWLGASGHFGLGNSNTLATVDVAGAYIGLASHSTILTGLLAFFITYGSPLLYMQAILLSKSSRKQSLEDVRRT